MKNDFFPKIHHVTMVGLSKRCLSLSVPKIRFWAAAPKGTKSCRTQGESVRPSFHTLGFGPFCFGPKCLDLGYLAEFGSE